MNKSFGFWCLFGAGIGAAIHGGDHAIYIFLTMFLYDAIKPEDKQ